MADLTFSRDREQVEISFFRGTASLPQIIRNLNSSTPFVCKEDGVIVAECLVQEKGEIHDIVNYASDNMEHGREILLYVMDHYRVLGAGYLEIGCGNAQLELYAMFQRCGFRVAEVWPNHYLDDSKTATVENGIINRDMVRFRADLNEKQLATTGYDASGRT